MKNLRFEKFSKLSEVQKMAITFMIGIFLTIGCITLYKTFAIYKEEKTFEVIEGTIPNFIKKDKDLEIAIMVDGKSSSETPQEEYYYVTVECEKDEADTISGEWDYTNKRVNMSGYITKPAVCTINFNSVFDSIIVDGEEKDNIPDKGDYQYNLTCNNVTNSRFDEETWKPVVTGVKENSSCNIVFKSTNSIITKIIDANGNEVESYPSKEEAGTAKITCTNGATGEWDRDNWKPIITNITNETTCEIEFTKELADMVTVGDYIAYTPNKTSYNMTADLTGISINQTINPSNLNLWRVIKINNDGTIEVVSEYTSGTTVIFAGQEGYRKLVGSLNTITKEAYETEGITVGSHHMGYDGEQDTCSAYNTCSDQKTDYTVESEDTRLVTAAVGSKKATSPGGGSTSSYLLASRYHKSGGQYRARMVNSNGNWDLDSLVEDDGRTIEAFGALRPIVVLRSGLSAIESEKDGKKLWTIEQ